MEVPLPDNIFKPLELPSEEQQCILRDTDELIAETLLACEDYVGHGRTLDPNYWKLVKTRDGMTIYRTKSRQNHRLPHLTDPDRDYFHDKSLLDQLRPPGIPLVISTGFIDGTVEDAAFGSLADIEHRARLRNSYIFPHYPRKLLATLQHPTEEDPFRYISVRWAQRSVGPDLPNRDFLFIESSGLAIDSKGERAHYFLMATVDLGDKIPELTDYGIVRGTGSICFIYRKFDAERVEVFCRSYTDPKSDALVNKTLASTAFAESLISPHTVVECSYVKKLMWLMVHKYPKQTSSFTQAAMDNTKQSCDVCAKSIEVAKFVCQVCYRMCCACCTVSKQIVIESDDEDEVSDEPVRKTPLGCCLQCVLEAKQLPAWEVAIAMLQATKHRVSR